VQGFHSILERYGVSNFEPSKPVAGKKTALSAIK
jgi:hypothetical protein